MNYDKSFKVAVRRLGMIEDRGECYACDELGFRNAGRADSGDPLAYVCPKHLFHEFSFNFSNTNAKCVSCRCILDGPHILVVDMLNLVDIIIAGRYHKKCFKTFNFKIMRDRIQVAAQLLV